MRHSTLTLVLGIALLSGGCDPGAGTGLLVLRLSADPIQPPPPGNAIVLSGTGSLHRTIRAAFPPTGPAPLVVEYPNLPAGGIDITVKTLDGNGCTVGETATATHVSIKGGAKTTADLTIRRSASPCGDSGAVDSASPVGDVGAMDTGGTSDAMAERPARETARNEDTPGPRDIEDRPDLRDTEDVPQMPSDGSEVARAEQDAVSSLPEIGILSLSDVQLVVVDTAEAGVVDGTQTDALGVRLDGLVSPGDATNAVDTPAIDCGSPSSPENGFVAELSSTTVGGKATYACFDGYGASGSLTRLCQADGTWSGTLPSCIPANCGALEAPKNGGVSYSATTYKATASYSCIIGFTLTGAATRACQADGTWSGIVPACAPDCPSLSAPENGFVNHPNTKYGATASYTCKPGFELSGEPTRTCQATGTWSNSAPACVCAGGLMACSGVCVDTQNSLANCGSCGDVCAAAGPSTARCAAGRCLLTLATGQTYPSGLAVDETSVYWTTSTPGHGGDVQKVALGGGSPVVFPHASGFFGPNGGLSIDAQNAYWETDNPAIMMAPLDGLTAPRAIAKCCYQPYGGTTPYDGYVYWGDSNGTVMRVTTDGTDVTQQVSPSLPYTPMSVTVKDGLVFWASSDGNIMRMPIDNTASPTSIGVGESAAGAIAVDNAFVYWTIPTAGKVVKTARDASSSTPPTVLASGQGYPAGIGLDASRVYWSNSQDGTVMARPLPDGDPTPLVAGESSPGRLVVTHASICWIDQGSSGSIMRLVKK